MDLSCVAQPPNPAQPPIEQQQSVVLVKQCFLAYGKCKTRLPLSLCLLGSPRRVQLALATATLHVTLASTSCPAKRTG
jgi:hypothetical protein